MKHHTVTTTLAAPHDEVFAYLADIEKLPEWATEFARELRLVDGRHKVVNGLARDGWTASTWDDSPSGDWLVEND